MAENTNVDRKIIDKNNVSFYKMDQLREATPKNFNELEEIVREARSTRRSIYPISTGYNWGLGSKIPVEEDCLVVNLSQFNEICDYDAQKGVVVIEPGVTQEKLCNFLKEESSLFHLDVTGASKETSVVGNILDRGVSYNSLRVENVIGLEILTGEGKLIRTGSWRIENSKVKYSYKYGVGAELTGLFFQSNMGIVTKVVYKLKKYQKENLSVQLKFESIDQLANSLEPYSELFQDGVIQSIFHMANAERARGAIIPYLRKTLSKSGASDSEEAAQKILARSITSGWIASGVVSGESRADVRRKVRTLKRALSPYARVEVMSIKTLKAGHKILGLLKRTKVFSLISGAMPFMLLHLGEATNAAMGSVLDYNIFLGHSRHAHLVDQSEKGFVFCLPLTDLNKEDCLGMVGVIEKVAQEYNFVPSITLNPILANILEAVVSLEFTRFNAEGAHKCIRVMQQELIANGHIPYRTNIKDMDLFFSNDDYQDYLAKIKKIFDPDEIISPGRYLPKVPQI